MKTYPFYNALTHIKEFYDITLEDDEFETIGMHGWDKIGNKYTATYHYNGRVVNGILDLPCNADIIEMVTTGDEEFQSIDNIQTENYGRLEVETYIEGRKPAGNSLYTRGHMVQYAIQDGQLIFSDKKIHSVRMIYKGVFLDDEGLPFLNYKEVDAIAAYCAYVYMNKKGMTTRDQGTIQIAQMLKQEWNRLCENARTPVYLDQNDLNQIMDVKSSWDRKRHGVSYKLFS